MQKVEKTRPRKDAERDMEPADLDLEVPDQTYGADLERGEGGTMGLPTKPEDLGHDD
jgi:hypothetical protein